MRVALVLCLWVASCANARTTADPRAGTHPIATQDEGKGVSLTGTGAYGDRYDPSGWTGQSKPIAVGGGPAPPAPAPTASASTVPPSKELDTAPPSKDLSF